VGEYFLINYMAGDSERQVDVEPPGKKRTLKNSNAIEETAAVASSSTAAGNTNSFTLNN